MITRLFEILLWWLLQIAAVVLMLATAPAWAQERIGIVFDGVRLPDLARLAYGEIERKPFVLSPEFDQSDKRLSLRLQAVPKHEAVRAVADAIRAEGFVIEQRGAVLWIVPKAPEAEIEVIEIYRPRYRAASYLLDVLAPFFKPGAFGSQRGVSMIQPAVSEGLPAVVPERKGKANQQRPADSGTSAFSIQDRQPEVLAFHGSEPDRQKFLRLVADLDTRPDELLVKAIVFEVATDRQEGSALALAASVLNGKLGIRLGKQSPGDWSAVFHGSSFDVVYNALGQDSRFKVVSSPRLRVLSGQSARLMVGADTPVLGPTSLDKNGNPVQSVEYKPSGVILDLRPHVRADMAELTISQQISNFVPTNTGVNNSPTLIKRELSTSVGVSSDDVLILGGLDDSKDSLSESGPSWLPAFVRGSSAQKSKSEILLILQAQRI